MKNTPQVSTKPVTKNSKLQAVNLSQSVPELKIERLRECSAETLTADEPKHIEKFWRDNVEKSLHFNADVESLWVFLLNTRYKLIGFQQLSQGTRDTVLFEPGIVFRAAVVQNAAAIVVAHNHPSGDPSPSDSDIKATRDILRAGRLLKIELLDHLIFGSPKLEKPYVSLREQGVFGDESSNVSDKKATKDALSSAVSKLELVTSESKSFLRLLANNFEYLTHGGDISSQDKDFTAGIYFLVTQFQERLSTVFNEVHAAKCSISKVI